MISRALLEESSTAIGGKERARVRRLLGAESAAIFRRSRAPRRPTYYAECEQRLLAELLPDLAGKSALQDRPLGRGEEHRDPALGRRTWRAGGGLRHRARDRRRCARASSPGIGRAFAAGDVRRIPFADATLRSRLLDGHDRALSRVPAGASTEIFRVMKPGGRAVIGVPNLFDPFLRPLLVAVLDRLGRYDYGLEKAFTHGGFRRLLESAGFRVLGALGDPVHAGLAAHGGSLAARARQPRGAPDRRPTRPFAGPTVAFRPSGGTAT